MASIAGLCWTNSEELFSDLDLDVLYSRQIRAVDSASCANYPYLLLVFTGKITIGINLNRTYESVGGPWRLGGAKEGPGVEGTYSPWHLRKEPTE